MNFDLSSHLVYVDDALLVVDKPAGLPTLRDGWNPDAPYLVGLLREHYTPLWVVHRLDRDTSGVIVLARTAEAHRSLNIQFEGRREERVRKEYHALVTGVPGWETRTVRLPLLVNGDRRHRTVVDPRRGKPALTELRVLQRFASHALVEALPHTGRTHQIRAHLAALGLPLAGDRLYQPAATPDDSVQIRRAALHACSLGLAHPEDGRAILFSAPYAADFQQFIDQLSRN